MLKRSAQLVMSKTTRFAVPCLVAFLAHNTGCSSCGDRSQQRPAPAGTSAAPFEPPPSTAALPPNRAAPIDPQGGTGTAVRVGTYDGGSGQASKPNPPKPPNPDAIHKDAICKKLIATIAGNATAESSIPVRISDAPPIRQAVDELIRCQAVASDAKARCLLATKSRQEECVEAVNLLHQFKALSSKTKFIFSDDQYRNCKADPKDTLHEYCDVFREVADTGDLSKCPKGGKLETACRGFFTLDKSLCSGVPNCEEAIDNAKKLGGTLKTMASEGTALEKLEAHAALEGPKACAALAAKVEQGCIHYLETSVDEAAH